MDGGFLQAKKPSQKAWSATPNMQHPKTKKHSPSKVLLKAEILLKTITHVRL